MKKIIAAGIAVLVLLVSLTGCDEESTKIPDEPPSITITAGDVTINWRVGKNKWDGMPIEHIADFPNIMSHTTFDDLPYIKNGESITIKFDTNTPNLQSYTLTEYILKDDGTLEYGFIPKEYDFNILLSTGSLIVQPVGSFIIEPNYSFLSFFSGEYEAGNTIKGYRLVCTWGGNECEYVFIIRGDAAIPLADNQNEFPTNEYGLTYGTTRYATSIEEEPDLIEAIGVDGIEGYVYSKDLHADLAKNPEEAIAFMEIYNEKMKDAKSGDRVVMRTIPLYEVDGKTVIGEFEIANTKP